MRVLFLAFFLFVLAFPALAVEPGEILPDPVLESRARDISRQLRCLVCQGEDIDESNAGLAADIRKLVREKLQEGKTDEEVLSFVQSRYGDYVLMMPPVKPVTYVLWLTPLGALACGLGLAWLYVRKSSAKGA